MIESTGSLVYGLPLNAHDLIKAGKAYDKFVPNAFVLDLIIARKERGGVVKYEKRWEGRIGLVDLPIEVLEMIRWELLQIYVGEEESYFAIAHDFLTEYFEECARDEGMFPAHDDGCEECRAQMEEKCDEISQKRERWNDPEKWGEWEWKVHDEDGCDICYDMSRCCGVWEWFPEPAKVKLHRLLRVYGLALPSTTILTQNILDADRADHLAFVIALPVYGNGDFSDFPPSPFDPLASVHEVEYDDEDPFGTCHTASYFSPNFFDTSFADDVKFRRLVRDFSLRVEPIDMMSVTRNTEGEALEKQEQEQEQKEVKGTEAEGAEEAIEEEEEEGLEGESDSVMKEVDKKGEEPIPPAPPAVQPEWMLVHYTCDLW